MSTLILFTYDDGEKVASVSWSAEFGWIKAGDREVLDRITVEERQSRTEQAARAPQTHTVSPTAPVDIVEIAGGATGKCFTCGCTEAAHFDEDNDGCAKHGCRTFLD